MTSVTLSAPAMFADHHVLQARKALFALEGIDDVYASSAWQAVIVSYNPDQVDVPAIEQALAEAGYASDKTTPILAQSGVQEKDPAWNISGVRATQTNEADLRMSGEFRKY
jgi:copper chaperone CopZ